jgi:hypothetical protein
VIARIQRYVDRGDYPYVAAEMVTKELCREGRQDEMLMLFWPPRLFEVWEESQQHKWTDGQREATHGRRRVDCDVLRREKSLLESLVKVESNWFRMGDLTRSMCQLLAREQKKTALLHAHRARFFHALTESLGENARVREAFDEATLERIYRDAKP